MFDIGFWELALIGILALVVLGPKRLPEAARTAGRWVGKLRLFIANVKQDIDREIDSGELADLRRLKEELTQARSLIEETSHSIHQKVDQLADNVAKEAKKIKSPATKELPGGKKKSRAKKKALTNEKTAKKRPARKTAAKKKTRKRKA